MLVNIRSSVDTVLMRSQLNGMNHRITQFGSESGSASCPSDYDIRSDGLIVLHLIGSDRTCLFMDFRSAF